MHITYDHSLKVAGVGMLPWRRLGPERWFPNYAIASLYDNGGVAYGPRVVALSSKDAPAVLNRRNTRTLLANEEFQKRIDAELPGYDLMLYRATHTPPALMNRKVLMPDERLVRTYEDKVLFRQKFSSIIPFAPFSIVARSALQPENTAYAKLSKLYPNGMVIQDAHLSGGQGTFIIKDFTAYERAVKCLARPGMQDEPVVVSKMLSSARELSVQACVTQKGIYVGPLQRQVIHDSLLSLDVPGASSFCGIQITANEQESELHEQLVRIAQQIGEVMKEEGYRGIFGIDFLQAQDGTVYVLEVNPRITGATPLLSALYSTEEAIPFYLLHILELGGYSYQVVDDTARFVKDGSLLVVHSLLPEAALVAELPRAGTYRMVDGELQRVGDQLSLDGLMSNEFVLLPQTQLGERVSPGGMLVSMLFNRSVVDVETGKIQDDVREIVTTQRATIRLTQEEVSK